MSEEGGAECANREGLGECGAGGWGRVAHGGRWVSAVSGECDAVEGECPVKWSRIAVIAKRVREWVRVVGR